jgi:hypothetical protein
MPADAYGFKIGDRVENSYGYAGRVSKIDGGTVVLTYQERGVEWKSTHTAEWFKQYPGMLKLLRS